MAVVFHWPLSDMIEMGLGELMEWRRLAAARNNPEEE